MLKVVKENDRYLISLVQVRKLNTLFSELIGQQLNSLVSISGRTVVFDLGEIESIDKDGFSTLLTAAEIAAAVGSKFHLCNLRGEIEELISKNNMQGAFNILPDQEVKENFVFEMDE